jgi:hypothetical protein
MTGNERRKPMSSPNPLEDTYVDHVEKVAMPDSMIYDFDITRRKQTIRRKPMSIVLDRIEGFELGITFGFGAWDSWGLRIELGKVALHIGHFYTGDYDDAYWRWN